MVTDGFVCCGHAWGCNDSEVHRVGGAGYALLAEPAVCVRVDPDVPRAEIPARRRSRSLLLPEISPRDHSDSVPGDQLHGHALWRAASVLLPASAIVPFDYASRDQGNLACFGASAGPHHGYAFLLSRPQYRDCGGQFPFAPFRTKHRPADLSFLLRLINCTSRLRIFADCPAQFPDCKSSNKFLFLRRSYEVQNAGSDRCPDHGFLGANRNPNHTPNPANFREFQMRMLWQDGGVRFERCARRLHG